MSEQFQSGIYGGNLWNLSRDYFGSSSCSISSSCNNQQLFDTTNNINSPSRLSNESNASDGNILLEDLEKSQQPTSGPRLWTQDMIFINDQQAEENYYSNTSREAIISSSVINYWQQTIRLMDCCPQTIDKTCQSPSDISPNIIPFDSYSYTNGTTSPFSKNLLETDINQQQSLLEYPQTNSSSHNLSDTFRKDDQSPIVKPSFLSACLSHKPLTQPQFLPPLSHHGETKANPRPLSATNEEERDIGSVAKKAVINHEPAMSKRPRVGTPSPLLPTFKVRKEKLGDRVTALQQLVSPFGKTDTASVLHEAIEYIKFLHDQVSALSGPYLKNGSHRLQRHREATHHHRDNDDDDDQASRNFQDLKSHGLCLVPISSAFPLLASETTTDLWTPTLRLEQSFRI